MRGAAPISAATQRTADGPTPRGLGPCELLDTAHTKPAVKRASCRVPHNRLDLTWGGSEVAVAKGWGPLNSLAGHEDLCTKAARGLATP